MPKISRAIVEDIEQITVAYFRLPKYKIGVVTLVIASLLVIGWMKGASMNDSFNFRNIFGKRGHRFPTCAHAKYKVFFHFHEHNDLLETPEPMDEADIYSELFGSIQYDGDYFGIVDQNGGVLQFMYEASKDLYWGDIPCVSKKGSFGRYLTFDETADLLKSLPDRFEPAAFPDFKFESWSSE